MAETDNIAMLNEDITDLKASITLLEMIKKSFMLKIKKLEYKNKIEISRQIMLEDFNKYLKEWESHYTFKIIYFFTLLMFLGILLTTLIICEKYFNTNSF
ncbi:hypothetical protein ES708_27765 [subsurface metagenome]